MLCCMQIIQVNLTSEGSQPLKPGTSLEFTYSVQWIPTDITFARRFERYLDYNFFEHQVGGFCTEHGDPSARHDVLLLIRIC